MSYSSLLYTTWPDTRVLLVPSSRVYDLIKVRVCTLQVLEPISSRAYWAQGKHPEQLTVKETVCALPCVLFIADLRRTY